METIRLAQCLNMPHGRGSSCCGTESPWRNWEQVAEFKEKYRKKLQGRSYITETVCVKVSCSGQAHTQ